MGAQFSSDGGRSHSPGLSSLGSNGQSTARTPRSASERSLALSSSGASSCRHSVRHRTFSGQSPDRPLSSFPHYFVSPPMRRADAESHRKRANGAEASFRWGSLARALPNLMRGNGGDGAAFGRTGRIGKRQTTIAESGVGSAHCYRQGHHQHFVELDANNNEPSRSEPEQQHFSVYTDSTQKSPCSAEERNNGQNFSLKASIKKSSSRLFSSIVRNSYFRSLLSDEDEDEEEDEDSEEEEEEVEEEQKFGGPFDRDTLNNVVLRQQPRQAQFPFQQPPHLPAKSNLRSSLRNCAKRHLLAGQPPVQPPSNGLVSSMLLAMAAGHHQPVPRPLSHPNEKRRESGTTSKKMGMAMVDWNGNNCGAAVAPFGNSAGAFVQEQLFSRKKIIQASSTELMRALGQFIGMHCRRPIQFEPVQLTTWLRGVDRALILQGWQECAFINPANLVFLFLLIRDSFVAGECTRLHTLDELHSFVLLCLYISYSYMGNEISYPLKPFITENTNRTLFWSQCVRLIKAHSSQMLRLNSSSAFFLEVFTEMKSYCSADAYP